MAYCKLCGHQGCESQTVDGTGLLIKCSFGYSYRMDQSILTLDADEYFKCERLIFEHLLFQPYFEKSTYWCFYYDKNFVAAEEKEKKYINIAELMQEYPVTVIERVNRSLLCLSKLHHNYGDYVNYEHMDSKALFCNEKFEEAAGFLLIMEEFGYLKHDDRFDSLYRISAKGWEKIEELEKKKNEIDQGFIAMRFGEETVHIREAFKTAIRESGYMPCVIDEKQHNNQIVPELFYEIGRSKFIVVDVTYPNYGAYYEAGYAQGRGKEVIVCCKKEIFETEDVKEKRPHFDIAQKAMIVWDDLPDLVLRLKNRIMATVL